MKNNRMHLKAASLAALLAVAPAFTVQANTGRDSVQVAPHNAVDFTAEKLTGQDVIGRDGKSLGSIKDFAIGVDGSPVYALVSAGGVFGLGEKLRLIPTAALKPAVARDRKGFNVQIDEATWNQIATVERQSLDSGNYRFTREQHRQLADRFGDLDERVSFRDDGAQLIRAGTLRDKDVRAGAEEIGEIDGIVIDLESSTASVLLETEDEFLGSEQVVLIPFNKLTLNAARSDVIATSLTRDDFAHLQSENANTTTTARVHATRNDDDVQLRADTRTPAADHPQVRKPAVISENQGLSPTGRANTRQDPEELLEIGARSVRDILKAEPAFANSRIDVKPHHGHLVLTGTVSSEQMRARIYDTAKGASGFPVLNNIQVDLDRR